MYQVMYFLVKSCKLMAYFCSSTLCLHDCTGLQYLLDSTVMCLFGFTIWNLVKFVSVVQDKKTIIHCNFVPYRVFKNHVWKGLIYLYNSNGYKIILSFTSYYWDPVHNVIMWPIFLLVILDTLLTFKTCVCTRHIKR